MPFLSHARLVSALMSGCALAACFGTGTSGDAIVPMPPATADGDAGASPASSTPGLKGAAERGQALVAERGCAGCHQSGDENGGTLAGRASPVGGSAFPPNLTPDKDTGIGDWTEEQIVRAIREGKDDEMNDLCSVMPRYADLSYAQASDIVAYLRALSPVKNRVPESACDDVSDDGGASDGEVADARASDGSVDPGASDAASDAGSDAGADAGGGGCEGFTPPGATAQCHGCGTHVCQPNGCYGGYYCEVATSKCHPKPATCP